MVMVEAIVQAIFPTAFFNQTAAESGVVLTETIQKP
jgi:hypothetical protein